MNTSSDKGTETKENLYEDLHYIPYIS
jgi:hypothetical protein